MSCYATRTFNGQKNPLSFTSKRPMNTCIQCVHFASKAILIFLHKILPSRCKWKQEILIPWIKSQIIALDLIQHQLSDIPPSTITIFAISPTEVLLAKRKPFF